MMTVLLVMLGKISRVLMMLICRNYLCFKSLELTGTECFMDIFSTYQCDLDDGWSTEERTVCYGLDI
jgi:hypothetical protein